VEFSYGTSITVPPDLIEGSEGRLYQAGYPANPNCYVGFDVVVNAAAGDPGPTGPTSDFMGLYVSLAMSDNTIEEEDEQAIRLVCGVVAEALREGRAVLVHCAQGWNRSGLIVAGTLVRLGMSPSDAVAHVRRDRGGGVLSNRSYLRWLLNQTTA